MSSKRSDIRVAIIGIGRIGYTLEEDELRQKPCTHWGAITENSLLRLSAVCDSNSFVLEKHFSQMPEVKLFNDHNILLGSDQFDVVVIATDSYTHIKIIDDILNTQKNVKAIVCEKPLAISYEQAISIEDRILNRKISFYLNHTRRWNHHYRRVKYIIENKSLGLLRQMTGFINAGGQSVNSEGPLLHDGTHLIDIALYFGGDIRELLFKDVKYKEDIEHVVNMFYRSCDDVDVFLNLSSDKSFFHFELELFFEKGRILIGNRNSKVFKVKESDSFSGFREALPAKWEEIVPDVDFKEFNFFEKLYQDVVQNIKDNIVDTSGYQQGLVVNRVIDEILKNN